MRVKAGGTSLRISSPDGGAPILDSQSEFGSRFFHVNWLHKRTNFYVQDGARNWSPDALALRVQLISLSIGNIASYLKAYEAKGSAAVRFDWPVGTETALEAWDIRAIIASMRGGVVIEAEDIEPKSPEDILALYEQS